MAIKKYKPTSPARRFMSVSAFEEITAKSPERSLLGNIKKNGGRNNAGRMTVRHQGGGNTRKYRIIDFNALRTAFPPAWPVLNMIPTVRPTSRCWSIGTARKIYSCALRPECQRYALFGCGR